MSKAVVINVGQARFLTETDESVEVPSELVSVSSPSVQGVSEGMTPVVDIRDAGRHLAGVKEFIVEFCNELSDATSKISKPESFTFEFGIKLVGEAGIPMLTKASGEASIKVTIGWKPKQ